MEWLREQIYNNFIADNRWRYLTNGLKVTLEVTFFAVLIGIVLGLLVAVVRSTYAKTGKMKIGSFLCGIYITVIRGTPVVVQLLIIYFVVFGSVKIDKVLEIFVPDETIKQRVSGRRVCEGCGATYHIQFKPSKVEGVCDKCGAKTIIRKDDQPETVLDRLAVYHKTTEPLKAYYEKQGKLETVIGQEEVADTTALVLKAVGVK